MSNTLAARRIHVFSDGVCVSGRDHDSAGFVPTRSRGDPAAWWAVARQAASLRHARPCPGAPAATMNRSPVGACAAEAISRPFRGGEEVVAGVDSRPRILGLRLAPLRVGLLRLHLPVAGLRPIRGLRASSRGHRSHPSGPHSVSAQRAGTQPSRSEYLWLLVRGDSSSSRDNARCQVREIDGFILEDECSYRPSSTP